MYRGTPEQPAVVKVYGPTRVRVTARLEYSANTKELKDDWLLIHIGNRTHRVPINNDLTVPGLRVLDADNSAVGRLSRFEFDLAAGEHEIRLSAKRSSILFNVDLLRPELPLSVLPPMNADAVESFTKRSNDRAFTNWDRIRVIENCKLVSPIDIVKSQQRKLEASASRTTVDEWLASVRGTPSWQQGSSQSQPAAQLSELIWKAEQDTRGWAEHLAHGEQIFWQNVTQAELNPLISRLRRLTAAQWTQITNIEQDAGVHIREIQGWQPESPTLRVRKALMGSVGNEERVVTGSVKLGLSLFNIEAMDLDLTLSTMDIPFLPRSPMTVHYSLDDDTQYLVHLSAHETRRNFTVSVPDGTHALRVVIEQPIANQYVKVAVKEEDRVFAEPVSRLYHVATHDSPVKLLVKGPAWLRVDEFRDDEPSHRYAFVESGWRRVILEPPEGRTEALYRIHQRLPGSSRATTPTIVETELVDIPTSPLKIEVAAAESQVAINEDLEPDARGTWSAYISLNSRRNFDEDLAEADEQDEFFEGRGEYRWFSHDEVFHHRSLVLGRLRSDGNPTIGAAHRFTFDNDKWPFRLQFNGSILSQDIDSPSSSLETSINLSASTSRTFNIDPRSDVIPRLRVFWRSLSLDDAPNTSDQIDQDVFTRYKSDHKSGLTLSGLYLHRPWQDTQWIVGASVTTNELFDIGDLEYFQLRTGWRQLVGPGVLDGEFRIRRYLDDDDRVESVTRPSLRMNLDVEKWQLDRSRWQLSFSFNRDFESQDNSIRVELSRIFSRHRGFRDFRLDETRFRRLREERYRQLYQKDLDG
jgi:hypothetical protein